MDLQPHRRHPVPLSPFRRARASVIGAAGLALAALLGAPSPALAFKDQIAMFEDDSAMYSDPASTLRTLRELGVGTVRVSLHWSKIAPDPAARRPPHGWRGADPQSYPRASWTQIDAIVEAAAATRMQVDFVLAGPGPVWAIGRGAPSRGGPFPQWKPSAGAYGQFVHAVATRYSGHYRARGTSSVLPPVRFWEIWNEPNFGQDLAPQATDNSNVSVSPSIYRGLLRSAWNAFTVTGHAHDTILVGGLSPRGFRGPATPRWPQGLPGNFSTTKPLSFIRTLFCLDSNYQPLRGGAAATVGCPSTAAGSRLFRSANPALFEASGFAIHPYPFNAPPTEADSTDPNYAEFSELPRLARTLDRVQRPYGSNLQLPVFNTEYGYITNPPRRGGAFASPATAAFYMNWAEYISWQDPRIASMAQYLLTDPDPSHGVPEYGGFASGLRFYTGRPKPSYFAYRMPIFLPVTSTRPGHPLIVWGCVRPAHYARADTHGTPQWVEIQFRPARQGSFRTIKRIMIADVHGYFEAGVAFPASGTVRLAWSYPDGRAITSRLVTVSLG